MWWLREQSQPTHLVPAGLPRREAAYVPAPTVSRELTNSSQVRSHQTPRQILGPNVAYGHPPAPLVKRPPLQDNLTADQHAANRLLLEVQCGHEPEIERLRCDVESLEKTVRSQTTEHANAVEQIRKLEQERDQLVGEVSDLKSRSLAERATFEGQLVDKQRQLASLTDAFAKLEQEHSEQTTLAAKFRHRNAELSVHQAAMVRQQQVLTRQLDKRHSQWMDEVAQKDSLQSSLEYAEQLAATWQTHAYHVRNLAEQRSSEIDRIKCELSDCRADLIASESSREQLERANATQADEIAHLRSLQQKLDDANQRVEVWQTETQRSNNEKRAIAEQLSRLTLVSQEQLDEIARVRGQLGKHQQAATKQLKAFATKSRINELRTDRLKSEIEVLKDQNANLSFQVRQQRTLRVAEASQSQRSQHADVLELSKLKSQFKTKELELASAWESCQECMDRLHIQEEAIAKAKQNETRMLDIHWSQCVSMQTKIDALMIDVESERESLRLLQEQRATDIDAHATELQSLHQQLSELESLNQQASSDYDSLKTERDQLAAELQQHHMTCEQERANAEELRMQSAKLRAQLSGGRARGKLLIEQYEAKLSKKRNVIGELESRIVSLQAQLIYTQSTASHRREAA
ncbi:Chromosome partition protein Smc [Rubripirellula amarantea]|uniref:Chromosome partition protein Smc n=2 Tax=Rubripirellula amarantea TaxID=2527999 RepID=A0A5C5WGY3_9BACT|nr:Chromosome partition protein Smc [Rubripirellula amarantea]